jgi:hypothetical protein
VDGAEGAKAPDHVPEDWLERYGTRRHPAGMSRGRDPGDDQSLSQLVSWIAIITGIGAVVAWLQAGVPGMVALIVPVAVICTCAILGVRALMRSDAGSAGDQQR